MSELPDIPSPCLGVCALDPATRACTACLRTTREIARWPYAGHDEKLEIVQALRQRRRAMGVTSDADSRTRRRGRQ